MKSRKTFLSLSIVIFAIACLQLLSFSTFAKGKKPGGVGDGGGTGLACFLNIKDAEHALDSEGRIKPEYRARIHNLWVTDFIEFGSHVLIDPLKNESPEHYLERVIDQRVKPLSPLFAEKVKDALARIKKQPVDSLPALHDVGETPDLTDLLQRYKGCVFVQIAKRLESTENDPTIVVQYDADLYEKLFSLNTMDLTKIKPEWGIDQRKAIQNQAFLWLHEAIYAMGSELGHTKSVSARKLTSLLLSENLYNKTNGVLNSFDFLFVLHSTGFLDADFFGDPNDRSTNPVTIHIKMERRNALQDLFNRVERMVKDELKARRFDCDKIEARWKDTSCLWLAAGSMVSPFMVWSMHFTPQELESKPDVYAFLINAHSTFQYREIDSMEKLLNFEYDDSALLEKICSYVQASKKNSDQNRIVYKNDPGMLNFLSFSMSRAEKAHRYCQSLVKKPVETQRNTIPKF